MTAHRGNYRIFQMTIAVVIFAVVLAIFVRLHGVTEVDIAFFLFGGLFPVLLMLVAPFRARGANPFGPLPEDESFLRVLCLVSAELSAVAIGWSRLLASEFQSRASVLASHAEFAALASAADASLYELWSITLPNVACSSIMAFLAIGTVFQLKARRFPRTWQLLVLWHLIVWIVLQAWFYTLHARVFA